MGKGIKTSEVTDYYFGRLDGSWNTLRDDNKTSKDIGPAIISITHCVYSEGTDNTYFVAINGRQQFGGFERHGYLSAVTRFDLVPVDWQEI